MTKIFIIYLLIIIGTLNSQEKTRLGESEIKQAKKVEFRNRDNSKANPDKIVIQEETGRVLAEKISANPNRTVNFNGYSVKRFSSSDSKFFGADVINIGADVSLGHINALQRILSSYIQELFNYNQSSADTVSKYVLYYNAMHRSEKSYFRNKYSTEVLDSLDIEKLGLAVSYKEWAGSTQLILPLEISQFSKRVEIPLMELEKEVDKVIETKIGGDGDKKRMIEIIKETKKEEQKLAKIIEEKKLEEKINKTGEKKTVPAIDKKTESVNKDVVQKKEEKITESIKDVKSEAKEDKKDAQANPIKSTENPVEKKENPPKEEAVVQNIEPKKEERPAPPEVKKPDPEVEKLKKENEDLKAKEKEREEKSENVVGDKILFLRMVKYEEDGHYTNELWMIDGKNEETIYRSPYTNICGKEFHVLPKGGVVVIGFDGNRPTERIHKLVLLDGDKLTQKMVSKQEIYYRSHLILKEDKIYAFEKVKDQVYFTRFNSDLTVDAKSSEPVNTSSEITFFNEKIFLTGKPSETEETVIRVLQKSDLKVTKTIKPLERKK
jgi:hypothetical protein